MRLAFVGFLFLVGCGSSDDSSTMDGGSDAATDTTMPKPDSGGNDAAKDTGTGMDSGGDSGTGSDSGSDSGIVLDSGSDGSIVLDAGGPDASIVCGNKAGSGFQGMGQCGETETYTCVNDNYEIACQCPAATCTCKKNNQLTQTLNNVAGCPKCTFTFSNLAAQCGYPY